MPSPVYSSRISRAIVLREPVLPAIFSGAFNTFEGGTNTTTITTGNSGGTSGAPFDNVNIPSGGAAAFDSANAMHGGMAAKLIGGSISGNAYLAWQSATLGTLTDGYGRVYYKATAFTSTTPTIAWGLLAAATKWQIVIVPSSGAIRIVDSVGTAQATSTVTVTAGSYFRIEYHHNSSGQLVVRIFLSPDSSSPDETITASANTTGNIDEIRYASGTNTSMTAYIDDIAAGLTTWAGPSVTVSAIAPPNGAQVI
jgi:hypothetical protein